MRRTTFTIQFADLDLIFLCISCCFVFFSFPCFKRELVLLTSPSAYAACDVSDDTVWSEFRIRVLTTALMKQLAHTHSLDFLQGRLVAYVTCPLIPRAWSVLLMDHGIYNMVKKFKQTIRFCIPHHLAKRYRKHAFVRITLIFYKSHSYVYPTADEHERQAKELNKTESEANAALSMDAESSSSSGGVGRSFRRKPPPTSPAAHVASAPSSAPLPARPVTGLISDLYTAPIRVAECHFDLMSVREMNDATSPTGSSSSRADQGAENEEREAMEAQKRNEALEARAEQIAEEEEEVTSNSKYRSKVKAKKLSKKEMQDLERERLAKEWEAKWLPLVSSVKRLSAHTPMSGSHSVSSSSPAAVSDAEKEKKATGATGH